MINIKGFIRFLSWFSIGFGLAFLLLMLVGCDKDQTIRVEQPAVVNNTYITELYEEYLITNVTEQYITEEYYEVTNIEGAQVDIVPICHTGSGEFQEVLLRVDGVLVAYFAQNGDALKARLVVVPENTVLQTTDTRAKKFQIVDGEVICL